jgi:hypothetical protein
MGRCVGAVESREAPRCFCAKTGFWNGGGKGGNRIRNAVTGGTSETWNRELNTFERWDKILLPEPPHVHSCTFMPNDPKEDEIPLGIWCDLLEKELKAALDDLAKIRKAKSPSEKRDIGIMLRAALGNARHYLSELMDSLKE